MKFLKSLAVVAMLTMGLSGCWGEKVEVPPASVGMVLGASGYQGDIIPPSRFRLNPCLFNCDKLVVIEAGDATARESYTIRMPQENLDFGVNTRMTIALSTSRDNILRVYDRVTPQRLDSGNYGTTLATIYETYGSAVVGNTVRGVITEMSMNEALANQTAVSETIRLKLVEAFKRTPLEVREFTLTEMIVPDKMREAYEANQDKIIKIQTAEADAQVDIRKAQAELEVSRATRESEILKAQTVAETNQILAAGLTPDVMRYMELEVLKSLGQNQNTVFFPVDMMNSTAMANRVMGSK